VTTADDGEADGLLPDQLHQLLDALSRQHQLHILPPVSRLTPLTLAVDPSLKVGDGLTQSGQSKGDGDGGSPKLDVGEAEVG
jgi:hypothetical protein